MKYTLMMAALCFAAACVSPEAHRRVVSANDALQAQIAKLTEDLKDLDASNRRLLTENEELGARALDAAYVAEQKKKLADLLARYSPDSPSAIAGVDFVQTGEGYAFRVAGGVLFSPGQAALSEGGKATLRQLLDSLNGRRIRVEGHTDDQPIRASQWGTNLRLSVERALSVADFLIQSGLSSDRIGCAGYGEHRPAVEGNTDEARQKNRRVEILLLDK